MSEVFYQMLRQQRWETAKILKNLAVKVAWEEDMKLLKEADEKEEVIGEQVQGDEEAFPEFVEV